jgi:alkylated DNA repair dioxygenase AlkB
MLLLDSSAIECHVLFDAHDQQLIYLPNFFSSELFNEFVSSIEWQQNRIRVFGKWHDEPRLTCWYGLPYTYSGIAWPKREMTEPLQGICSRLQTLCNFPFNSVLANYYRDGKDSMGWHRDNEPEMDAALIASVSFGGARIFKMKNRNTNERIDVVLESGSVLLMVNMQQDWLHSIPKSAVKNQPRINLTFRKISS